MPYDYLGRPIKDVNQAKRTTAQTLATINPNKNYDNFDQVVQFIGQVAQNERRKELDSIKAYCEEIQTKLPTGIIDKFGFKKLLDPNYINENPQEFQKQFLVAFDAARRGLEHTKLQIQQTKNELDKKFTMKELENRNFRFSAHKNLDSLIQSLIKQQTKEQINGNELTSLLNAQVENIMSKLNIAKKFSSGEDVAGIASAIQSELSQRLQDVINNSDNLNNFEDTLKTNILNKISEDYIKELEENSPVSRLQKLLLNNDTTELSTLIQTAKDVLGLKQREIDPNIMAQFEKEAEALKMQQEKEVTTTCNNFQDQIKLNPALRASLYSLEVSISTDEKNLGAAGNINEFLEAVFQGGAKVKTNVATDLVSFHINYGVTINKTNVNSYMQDAANSLASIQTEISKLSDKYDINKITNKIIEVNNQLNNIVKQLDEQLKTVDEMGDKKAFIQLESLKLHAAGGQSGKRSSRGFQGRTMAITSYISYLSSMAGVSDNLAINTEDLSFLAYNLLPGGTLTYKNYKSGKKQLTDYFSLFSGMLMFDDVRNMAVEATQMITENNSSVETLHLYNLNGTYVPSSVVLQNMYDALNGQASINRTAKSFARANIIYKQRPPQEIGDIQVQITLLSNYENLINQLNGMLG